MRMLLIPPSSPRKELEIYQDSLQVSFDYKVFYSKPPSYDIPIKLIIPGGWGDEFKDNRPVSEKDKKAEKTEQPLQGAEDLSSQHLNKSDDEKKLDKEKACTVGVWKDEVIETVTKEMQEQPVCLPLEEELSLDLASLAFRV